jgi:hypothetical protein
LCPQPHFHGLSVKATWDGEVIHTVDLDIGFGIDAIPNSRLRLISLRAATDAGMTGVDENSPATTYTGGASTFLAQGVQMVEPRMDDKTQCVISDLRLDISAHSNRASRTSLPASRSGSSSPQRRLFSIAQRPSWRSPASKDTKMLGEGPVFPHHVIRVVHRVQLQARVYLRKDCAKVGHLLELQDSPTQDKTGGCFMLLIIGGEEGEYLT